MSDDPVTPTPVDWRPFFYCYDGQRLLGVEPTRDFVFEVERATDEHAGDPDGLAEWIVQRIEEYGGRQAQPVFDTEGCGPFCSWCGSLAMLCRHGSAT